MIAGEGAAGTVRAMHPGRQADDEEARLGVAERRYGLAEVIRLQLPHRIQEMGEPRATAAIRIEELVKWGKVHGLAESWVE